MIKYWFKYSDGQEITKQFSDMQDAQWFIHNEGDHLSEVKRIIDEQWDPTINGTGPAYTFLTD